MSVVAAALEMDKVSTNWSVQMSFAEARSFAHHRTVRYTFSLGNIIEKMQSIMNGEYSILTVGRECSRVLYLEWYNDRVPAKAFDFLGTFCDEFHYKIDQDTGWTKLRMWWD